MRAGVLFILLAVAGCQLEPDDVTIGTAVRDYRTNPAAGNHDWSIDYVSVAARWRLKPQRVHDD